MSKLPDFSSHGYQVVRELGHNFIGGRVTYLAKRINTQEDVVLKQFQFAHTQAHWSAYKAVEREIEVLQGLNHPGIPRYLDSFEQECGFCMVQEYKNAPSLAVRRSFDPEEIRVIAISVLEILVYLQNRIPPIIHRDLKPENILVDNEMNVYLVDFGFARIGGGDLAMSSLALGTLGFMAPEQIYGRQLNEATDLYGLGATLICLLTGTKSTAMNTLIDEDGRIAFGHLVPRLSPRFVQWLEQMVEPKLKDRFPSAKYALQTLSPLYIVRLPEVEIYKNVLEFKATQIGETLTQTITIKNKAPDTIFVGKWEVAPHPSDPPHTPDCHAWIHFLPNKFAGNFLHCQVSVDTSKLIINKIYQRQILLHTNSLPETHRITVKVQTAPFPRAQKKLPDASVALLFLFACTLALIGSELVAVYGIAFGLIVLPICFGALLASLKDWLGCVAWSAIYSFFIVLRAFMTKTGAIALVIAFVLSMASTVLLVVIGVVLGTIVTTVITNIMNEGFSKAFAVLLVLSTIASGSSLGIGWKMGFENQWILSAIALTGLASVSILLYPSINHQRLVAKHRQSEQNLIQP